MRWLTSLLVASLLCSAGAVVGSPRLVRAAPGMVTATEHVDLAPRPAAGQAAAAGVHLGSGPARRGAARDGDAFVLLGVSVAEVPTGPILVRARSGRHWTDWFEAEFTTGTKAESDDGAPGLHSAPIWTGQADGYEIDAPPDVLSLDVHLVGEEPAGISAVATGESAAGASAPAVHPRSEWGARPPVSTPTVASDLDLAVVHHSAGDSSYTQAEVPSVLRAIQAYHQDAQGWDDIAYNFAVDRFGRTWEARAGGIDKAVVGGHSAGFNTRSVGIVVLGEFTSASVPAAVTEALAQLIAWKFAIHTVYPGSTVAYTTLTGSAKYAAGTTVTLPRIVGHRDVQSTSCPGANLYAKLGALRSRVSALWPAQRARTVGTDTVGARRGADALVTNAVNGSGTPIQYLYGEPSDSVLVGDWNGDGVDTVGVRRDRSFILSNAPDGSGPLTTVTYGLATDVPIAGDWDGNGTDTIGVRRNASFLLRNSNTGGTAELAFNYGIASDVPVTGDWDGNLSETPGVRRGNIFYLRNANTSGPGQISFGYGATSDRPVVGDWDGNGVDTVGVRRANSFLLRNLNTTGIAQLTVPFGLATDSPLTGDWDGR